MRLATKSEAERTDGASVRERSSGPADHDRGQAADQWSSATPAERGVYDSAVGGRQLVAGVGKRGQGGRGQAPGDKDSIEDQKAAYESAERTAGTDHPNTEPARPDGRRQQGGEDHGEHGLMLSAGDFGGQRDIAVTATKGQGSQGKRNGQTFTHDQHQRAGDAERHHAFGR